MRTIILAFTLLIVSTIMLLSQSIVELNSPFISEIRVLHMDNSNTLFAGGDIGFFKTTDLGQTWDTELTQNIRSIYLYNDSTWYLCTYGGIFKTTNSGEQWIPFGQSLPTSLIDDIAINGNNNTIFAATSSGVFKSIDEGNNWIIILDCSSADYTNIECIGDTIIFLGKSSSTSNYDNLYRSFNNGSNWEVVDLGSFRGFLYKTPGNILFLGWQFLSTGRLYKSTNGGLDWPLIYAPSGISYFGPWTTGLNNSLIMQKSYWLNAGAYGILLLVSFNNFQTTTQYQLWPSSEPRSITSLTTNPNEEIFAGLIDGKIRKISGISLPVELTSFMANCVDGKVVLNWTTATELNNHGFEIERSFDSANWITIGFMEGKGTTAEQQDYAYIDDVSQLITPKLYYRLKQLDFNGSFEYSEVVEIEFAPSKFSLEQNYPNPFNPSTKISWQSPVGSWQMLKVYDVLGNEVATLVDEYKPAGSYEVEFKSAVGSLQLASGMYFYRLKAGDPSTSSGQSFVQTKKMILIK